MCQKVREVGAPAYFRRYLRLRLRVSSIGTSGYGGETSSESTPWLLAALAFGEQFRMLLQKFSLLRCPLPLTPR